MSNKTIRANTTGTSQRGADVTGTALSGGKFGFDVFSYGTEHFMAVLALVKGTMPSVNWDAISKTTNEDGSISYLFEYKDNRQFIVDVLNPFEDYSISVTAIFGIVAEDGISAIALESGDELLLEG